MVVISATFRPPPFDSSAAVTGLSPAEGLLLMHSQVPRNGLRRSHLQDLCLSSLLLGFAFETAYEVKIRVSDYSKHVEEYDVTLLSTSFGCRPEISQMKYRGSSSR